MSAEQIAIVKQLCPFGSRDTSLTHWPRSGWNCQGGPTIPGATMTSCPHCLGVESNYRQVNAIIECEAGDREIAVATGSR
jgi:hypothetical protein